ncbi:MAG: hypothetical protein M3P30_15410 [Chloroflexota bacterium]|nr:hypothetical protein [Chloroflexota bacterium]
MPSRATTPKPTFQDAQIMLQIAQLSAANGVPAAMNWLWSDDFNPDYAEFIKVHPHGSEVYGKARLIAVHYETIGTLWKNKLINEDLLFDWLSLTGVWDRLRSLILGERKAFRIRALGENFQKMARAQARREKSSS